MFGRVRVVCRLLLAATVLSVIACSGERSAETARGGTGGTVRVAGSGGVSGVDGGGGASGAAGGTGTAVDAGGADGGGPGGGSSVDASGCPTTVRNGDPCSEGQFQLACPITACAECIGDVWKFQQAGTTPNCQCVQGAWMCVALPGGGPIGDCIHEAPFTCVEAQTLYTDATCTVHPPCDP